MRGAVLLELKLKWKGAVVCNVYFGVETMIFVSCWQDEVVPSCLLHDINVGQAMDE
jgi:hypothetical protein